MPDANQALARHLYDRLNNADLTVVDDLISDAFVEHEEFPGLPPNKSGVRQMFEMFHTAFGNAKFEVDDLFGDGDKVSARARLTGVHQAEFMGIPATGNTINVPLADYFRFENGTIVEHWGVMDTGALMQQLGS